MPQKSHKTSLSFNAGAPGLYSSRQLTTTINFDTNPKKHFHKQNIQPRSSSRILQSLSSILKHQAASIAATRSRPPLYNKSEMGLHFASAEPQVAAMFCPQAANASGVTSGLNQKALSPNFAFKGEVSHASQKV